MLINTPLTSWILVMNAENGPFEKKISLSLGPSASNTTTTINTTTTRAQQQWF